jgi:hypothetical protein
MNTLGLVTFLRTNILDDTGGTGVDWTTITKNDDSSFQLRWTNEELVDNINEAILQVYRRSNPIKDIITLNVLSGVELYTLPSHVTKIALVKRSDGKAIVEKEVDDIWMLPYKIGDLIYYSSDYTTGSFRLYPTPKVDEVISLLVYRDPMIKLSWSSPVVSPELRESYHVPMLNYAAYLSYMKDEANTSDPTRAASFSNIFDKEFPPTSVYSQIRKSRTSNRPIKYIGI